MPQAIGAAILAALGASAASAATATLVGSIVIAGALTGAQLLAPKPDIPKPQDGKIQIKQAIPPAIYAYGRCRISGAYIAYELKGSTSYDVIALHQGRIDGYERFYLNDDLVVFSSTTTSGPGDGSVDGPVRLPGPYKGRYMGDSSDEKDTRIYWRKGDVPSPVYTELRDALPLLWTDAHRADGIATLLLICAMADDKSYTRRFPFGLPKASVVARWRCCWDPRDPDQIRANPVTWKWTDNPIVCLLDFFCHHPAGYLRPVEEVFQPRADWWFAGMDLCDELVDKADGTTVKRYTCGGQFTSETPRKSVVEALLRSCDGWISEYGDGSVIVYAGGYFPPSVTIEDRHIYDLKISRGRLPDERVTKLNLKISSPDHDYNDVPRDPWLSRLPQDVGATPIARDVRAEWCQDWTQMGRLGKIEFEKIRCDIRGTLVGRQFVENLRGRRYFMLNSTQQNSTRMVPCEVVDFHDNSFENGSYEVDFQTLDPDLRYAWNPATDEGRRPAIPDKSEDDEYPVPPPPTLSVIRTTVQGVTLAQISATSPPVDGWPDLTLGGRYRKEGEGDDDWLDMVSVKGKLQCLSPTVEDDDYEVQTFYIGGGGGEGDFSPVSEISVVSDDAPPGTPITPKADLQYDGGLVTGVALSVKSAKNEKHLGSLEAWRHRPDQTDPKVGVLIGGDKQDAVPNIPATWTDSPITGPRVWRYSYYAKNKSGVRSALFASAADVTVPDDFHRANQTLETNPNWTMAGGSPGAATIISNVLNAAIGTQRTAYFAPDLFSTNIYAEATLAYTGNRNDYPVAIGVDQNNFVGARYTGGAWSIVKTIASSATTTTLVGGAAPSVGGVARLEKSVSGGTATVTLKVGNVTVGSPVVISDAVIVNATKAGLVMRDASGAVATLFKAGFL